MKVILREDFERLGRMGDVVEVKDGYARNYLIPRNIAYQATASNLRVLEEEKKQLTRRIEKERVSAQTLAAKLEKISITIQMKVGEEDRLFGSVTAQMIAESLKEKGFEIDKRQIELEEPLKALGIYDVNVKLAGDVTGKIKVWVVRE